MARTHSTSYYPGPALTKYLQECEPVSSSPRQGKSALLNRALERYRAMVCASLPKWTIDEWTQVASVLRTMDVWPSSSIDVLGLVLQQGLEQRRKDGWADPNNVAYASKQLTVPARVAVAEVVERYFKQNTTVSAESLSKVLGRMGAPGFDHVEEPEEGQGVPSL
jgi:hypothetical protein